MTYDEFQTVMQTECNYCKEQAQWHRLTNAGNFYCLEATTHNRYTRALVKQQTPERQRMWAIARAKCNELRKSPLPQSLGRLIVKAVRTMPDDSAIAENQMELT
jgi:hypothetical protein